MNWTNWDAFTVYKMDCPPGSARIYRTRNRRSSVEQTVEYTSHHIETQRRNRPQLTIPSIQVSEQPSLLVQ